MDFGKFINIFCCYGEKYGSKTMTPALSFLRLHLDFLALLMGEKVVYFSKSHLKTFESFWFKLEQKGHKIPANNISTPL